MVKDDRFQIVYRIRYRRQSNRRKSVHPNGFEPLTFGSVVASCLAGSFYIPSKPIPIDLLVTATFTINPCHSRKLGT